MPQITGFGAYIVMDYRQQTIFGGVTLTILYFYIRG